MWVYNNNKIFIWYSATSIIVRGASQHIKYIQMCVCVHVRASICMCEYVCVYSCMCVCVCV